jgi:hypothetical protein
MVNLSYQGLGPTVQQVLTATILGLVFGVLYDRTHNLDRCQPGAQHRGLLGHGDPIARLGAGQPVRGGTAGKN